MFLRAVTCTLEPTKHYLIVQRGRMDGFLVLDYMPRAAEAVGALAGWVRAGKIKNKVDVQHGLENAPATLRAVGYHAVASLKIRTRERQVCPASWERVPGRSHCRRDTST